MKKFVVGFALCAFGFFGDNIRAGESPPVVDPASPPRRIVVKTAESPIYVLPTITFPKSDLLAAELETRHQMGSARAGLADPETFQTAKVVSRKGFLDTFAEYFRHSIRAEVDHLTFRDEQALLFPTDESIEKAFNQFISCSYEKHDFNKDTLVTVDPRLLKAKFKDKRMIEDLGDEWGWSVRILPNYYCIDNANGFVPLSPKVRILLRWASYSKATNSFLVAGIRNTEVSAFSHDGYGANSTTVLVFPGSKDLPPPVIEVSFHSTIYVFDGAPISSYSGASIYSVNSTSLHASDRAFTDDDKIFETARGSELVIITTHQRILDELSLK